MYLGIQYSLEKLFEKITPSPKNLWTTHCG
jgi:hypothetical protein